MDFVIEQIPDQPTVYMRRVGAYGSENYRLMAALKEWAVQKGLLEDGVIYGIAYDGMDTPPERCRYDVCLTAKADCPMDGPVRRGEIPGGEYAVFTIPHTAEAVRAFWASALRVLQDQGLPYDPAKPVMERYRDKLVKAGWCEFCVPVRES